MPYPSSIAGVPPRAPGLHAGPQFLSHVAQNARYKATPFARLLGRSLRCLQRDLRGGVKCTPKYLLDLLRATEAAQYLIVGHTVKEAVDRFCYCDTAHLSRSVRRHLGLWPSQVISAMKSGAETAENVQAILDKNGAFIQQAAIAFETMLQQRGLMLFSS